MEQLELHRLDLLQTSAASAGTLVVLPPGENKTHKVAVGDMSGVVQCFSVKKGEVVVSFKSLPGPQKVTAMVLGRSAKQRDKIFIAAGNTVRGVTKKGKEFFRFTSGLTDAISHLDVAEAHIWAACQQVHSHYVDGQDKGLYMAPDVIMATELMPLPGVGDWVPVLASRDCCIRVMGTDSKPIYEIPTTSAPTALRYCPEPHGGTAAKHAKARELLYGCQDGRLVQLLVDAGAVRQGFVIPGGAPGSKEGMRAAVTAIHCGADYSKTGCADIVIGREDGSLEVWDIDPQGQPQLVVSTNLPESITAVDGGFITNAGSPDIIVQTFTGKVIAFASHPAALVMAASEGGAPGLKPLGSFNSRANQQDLLAALNARIAKETAELADLKARVAKERERLASNASGAAAVSQSVVDVKHRLTMQDGAFLLYVESAVPLFALAIKSPVPLKLLDMPGHVAISSLSLPDPVNSNATLATYRFQESTNRLTLKFTAPEGAPGKVTVYIIPALPPKTCPTIEVQLLPLCLHQLVPSPSSVLRQQGPGAGLQGDEGAAVLFSQLQLERPFSELVFQGGFSASEVHSWLGGVLPGIPQHLPTGSSSSSNYLLFKQQGNGTLLGCVYGQEQATFLCESLTSMARLHDSMLAAATAARQRVSMRFKVHPMGLQHCCSLLWPRLEVQRRMARRRKLAAALQELAVQEGGDVGFLTADYQALLSDAQTPGNADQQAAAKPDTAADVDEGLDAAVGSIKQLFQDCCRFSTGATATVQRQLPALEKLLRSEAALQAAVDFMVGAI